MNCNFKEKLQSRPKNLSCRGLPNKPQLNWNSEAEYKIVKHYVKYSNNIQESSNYESLVAYYM